MLHQPYLSSFDLCSKYKSGLHAELPKLCVKRVRSCFNSQTDARPTNPSKFNTGSQEFSRVAQTPYFDGTVLIIKTSEAPVGTKEPRNETSRNLKSSSSEAMR